MRRRIIIAVLEKQEAKVFNLFPMMGGSNEEDERHLTAVYIYLHFRERLFLDDTRHFGFDFLHAGFGYMSPKRGGLDLYQHFYLLYINISFCVLIYWHCPDHNLWYSFIACSLSTAKRTTSRIAILFHKDAELCGFEIVD